MTGENSLYALRDVIRERRKSPQEGSYTCYLFEQGLDKILKKCGEENAEMIIAAKNSSKEELASEISDLFYHVLVMMEEKEIPLEMVMDILTERSKKIGNRKAVHKVDRNS